MAINNCWIKIKYIYIIYALSLSDGVGWMNNQDKCLLLCTTLISQVNVTDNSYIHAEQNTYQKVDFAPFL